jgi:hypothetical protein
MLLLFCCDKCFRWITSFPDFHCNYLHKWAFYLCAASKSELPVAISRYKEIKVVSEKVPFKLTSLFNIQTVSKTHIKQSHDE